jgi:hypothetical protein
MTQTPSNTRRFIRAAWTLLSFQVIASIGAVGVTGWAAFHVQEIGRDGANEERTTPAPQTEETFLVPGQGQEGPAPTEPAAGSPANPGPAPVDAAGEVKEDGTLSARVEPQPVDDGAAPITNGNDDVANVIREIFGRIFNGESAAPDNNPGRVTLADNGMGSLVASVTDDDGFNGSPTFVWLRDDVAIPGATTGSTYAMTMEDTGRTIRARATYIDGHDVQETITSEGIVGNPVVIQ